MVGFEEDYNEIEEQGRGAFSSYLSFGEWIFFAFGMEPNGELDRALGKLIPKSEDKHCRPTDGHEILRTFATELLESGEVVFRLSEKYRTMNNSAGGMTH